MNVSETSSQVRGMYTSAKLCVQLMSFIITYL